MIFRRFPAPDTRLRRLSGRVILLPVAGRRANAPNVRDHAQTFLGAFALLIAVGGLVLASPWTTEDGRRTALDDALLIAVAAVAGTAPSVDTATHWNLFGEIVLLVLIQAGGLGFMVGTSLVLQMLRRGPNSFSLNDALLVQDGSPALSLGEAVTLARRILRFTLWIEGLGAAALALVFLGEMPVHRAVWLGLFHSVSAFCNAGFDLNGGFLSFTRYRSSVPINLILMLLIQAGALSYLILADTARRRRWSALALETKIVLSLNAFLIGAGAVAFLAAEWNGALKGASPGARILAPLFQSVTARSAGFVTADLAQVTDFTLFAFVGLMFLGGAAGSTAGGVKLGTAGVVGAAVLSALRGRDEAQIFNRRLATPLVFRAMAVIGLMAIAQFVATLGLAVTEHAFGADPRFIDLLFEATSALGSVGLSTGITPSLSAAGKFVLCATTIFGKVGPLTVAYALQRRQRPSRYRFPEASVRIG